MTRLYDRMYMASLRGIKAQLRERKITLKQVAKETGTSYSYLRNILSGRAQSRPVLERVCEYLAAVEGNDAGDG